MAEAQAQMDLIGELPDGRKLYFAPEEVFRENAGYKVWDPNLGEHVTVAIAPVGQDHAYTDLNRARELAARHATEARTLADKASNERRSGNEIHAELSAQVSQAHALAALATAAGGGGILSIEDLGR